MRRRRRVWSEHVPYEVVARREVLAWFERYDMELMIAVRPGMERALPALVGAFATRGVRVNLWPMLDDASGRWANERNAIAFASWVRRLVDGLERDGVAAVEVAFDLEPPVQLVRALAQPAKAARLVAEHSLGSAASSPGEGTSDPIAELAAELRKRDIEVSSALVPVVLAGERWLRLLGAALGPPAWDHASVMLYSSILEGWSRGVLSRGDVRALLDRGCRATVRRFGDAAGVSLGAVGTGALGNEPVYRDPSELADDVAVARASGVDALTLFDLGGVVSRPPAERWLEAFVHTEPAHEPPPATAASRAASWLATRASGSP